MVSKAGEDFPEPLSPVMTVRLLRGISTSILRRLCWRAPCTEILFSIGWPWGNFYSRLFHGRTQTSEFIGVCVFEIKTPLYWKRFWHNMDSITWRSVKSAAGV